MLPLSEPEYKVHKANVIVRQGDTFYGVIQPYAQKDERASCLQEFQHQVKEANLHLFVNGRHLQPGDDVTVVWYTVLNDRL